MKKYTVILTLLATLMMLLAFMPVYATKPKPEKDKNGKPVVAFLMDALYTERWYKDRDYFKQYAEEQGVKAIIKTANSQAEKQEEQAREAIEAGADVLVVVPADGVKAGKIVEMAHEKDIQVIAYDRLIKHKNLDYFISFNNEEVGRKQAAYALANKPSGKYALINGPKRDLNSVLYHRGVMEVLNSSIERGDINLVYDEHQGEWSEMEAYMAATEILAQHPDIDCILAANDMFAIGANMALMENNLSGKVLLTGQDATVEGVQMLIDGSLDITIYKPIEKLAKKAAHVAAQIAKDEAVEAPEHVKINGSTFACWLLDVIKVTRNNIRETVIKDNHIDASDLTFK